MNTPFWKMKTSYSKRWARVFSFGGGRQSHAVMCLQAAGLLHYDLFIFSNVGLDSENPDTIEYIEKYTKPFAQKHHIPFIEIQKTRRGKVLTLMEFAMEQNRSVPLPAYLSTGAPANRTCTVEFKIRVVDRYLRTHGIRAEICGLGISTDEFQRAKTQEWKIDITTGQLKRLEYPLLDLRLNLNSCVKIIRDNGLPEPPKSSCFFCPFHSPAEWIRIKNQKPQLFEKAVELEKRLNEKRQYLGRDRMFLHRNLIPLEQAVGSQMDLFNEMDVCESGYCMI